MSNWNTNSPQNSRISFLSRYLSDENVVKKYFKITGRSYDITILSPFKKNVFLGNISEKHENAPNIRGTDFLYSIYKKHYTVISKDSDILIKVYAGRIDGLFAPKFYHDRRNTNFLKDLKYIGEKNIINEKGFCVFTEIDRRLYEYRKKIIILEILIFQILTGLFLKNFLIRSAIQSTDFHLHLKTVQTI